MSNVLPGCAGLYETPKVPGPGFGELLRSVDPSCALFDSLRTIQINLGNICNLACGHCHVSASPEGTRAMGKEVMDGIIRYLESRSGERLTLDITGGCPEMNPRFRYLVERTDRLGVRRILRTNLAIAAESGMEWLPAFYREHGLTLIASLPCFEAENADRQRGNGVFRRSVAVLQRLNGLGYGDSLELDLVYNPEGDAIPGPQAQLEALYRKELMGRYGIRFTNLFTITNVPIGRFRTRLEAAGSLCSYQRKLAGNFNPSAVSAIMCRSMINVDWMGRLYNCDFNQAVGLPITSADGVALDVSRLSEAARRGNRLVLADHCFGCTAGEGSSCFGATT